MLFLFIKTLLNWLLWMLNASASHLHQLHCPLWKFTKLVKTWTSHGLEAVVSFLSWCNRSNRLLMSTRCQWLRTITAVHNLNYLCGTCSLFVWGIRRLGSTADCTTTEELCDISASVLHCFRRAKSGCNMVQCPYVQPEGRTGEIVTRNLHVGRPATSC